MKEQNTSPGGSLAGYGSTLSSAARSRRGFLKLAGGVTALGAVLPLGVSTVFAQSGDWVVSSGFPASGGYISPVQPVGANFNGIGTYWEVNSGDGNALSLQVRASSDGVNFGDWTDVPPDPDERGGTPTNRYYGRMAFISGSYAQFRLNIPAGLSLKLVGLGFVDSAKGPTPPQVVPSGTPSGKPSRPYIISRADWGANESYRYSGGSEVWPKEYRAAKVIVIHHSETSNTYNANPAVDVRGIYYYHAITKGWGDIGYNYLIDWKGNIYEGRAGGENIVGGHAYQYNWGSVGICMIGSFSSVSPTQAQLDSLARLMAWECADKGIDPNARIFFVDRNNVATITGHRDVINTTCPGDTGYSKIPGLRQQVTTILGGSGGGGGAPATLDVSLKSVAFSPTTVTQNNLLQITATITNTGTTPLESQDPQPGYVYDEGQTYESQGFAKQNNKFRLAVEYTNNSTGVSHPYRWGFGKTLQPGETVTVTGYVRMKTARQVDMFGSIIQEYVKYFDDNVGTTRITTNAGGGTGGGGNGGPNPTARAASRASDPNITYFNETGHNLGYAFRAYWNAHGGLPVFGFPLTEEFKEESPSEPGKIYTVQYFQRNRFEYHSENQGTPYEVLLGLLGVQLTAGRTFFRVAPIPNTADRIYFNETGHTLGGAFYRYWKANGGLAQFGYAISEEFQERNPDDNKIYTVQYFQRNRFEFHPENRAPYDVLLGLLGTQLCRQKGWL